MASVPQQNPYQCDPCGTPNIVAVPLLYQQGSRNYSTAIGWGSSQTYSAQAAAPPCPRGYTRPFLFWGIPTFLFFLWSYAGFSAILERLKVRGTTAEEAAVFLLLGLTCLGGLISKLSRIFATIARSIHSPIGTGNTLICVGVVGRSWSFPRNR